MNKLIIILLGVLVFNGASIACINEYDKNIPSVSEPFGPYLKVKRYESSALYTHKQELEEKYKNTDSLHYLSDLAAVLMRLGDPITAKNLLLPVWDEENGTYNMAANIGTAYEQMGVYDSALLWIKKGINLNPGANSGSEWIHEMILRYKISKENNPGYTSGSSALSLDFGDKNLPVNTYNNNLQDLKQQLGLQLEERLSFSTAPDEIVGMLLFDYANIVALNDNIGDGLLYYKKAKEFGLDSYLLDARIARLEELVKKDASQKATEYTAEEIQDDSTINVYVVAALIALLAMIVVFLFMNRKKKVA